MNQERSIANRKGGLFKILIAVVMSISMAFALSACLQTPSEAPALKEATVDTPVIGEAGVLRVGVNTDKSPLAGVGNDKIIGIDVDIAAAIADELGLELNIVDVGSSPDAAISDNKVDMVLGVDSSENNSGFWVSSEYLPTGIAVFELESNNASLPNPDSAGNVSTKIAAQVSSKSAWAVTNSFGNDALASTSDLASAFSDLENGNVNFVASDAIIGMYAANRQGLDVKIVALLENPSGYCAGVATANTELQTIVNDTLSSLKSSGVIDVIERKWLGKEVDLTDIKVIGAKAQTSNNVGDEGAGNAEGGDAGNADAANTANTATASNASN